MICPESVCVFVCCRLCSLAQHAKEETDDSTTLGEKSLKPEPATSEEEEGADVKLSNITEDVDNKPSRGKSFFVFFYHKN